MGLYVEFDVIDDFGYLDMTEEYAIIPDYSEGCAVFAEVFLSVARQLCPVDTGYLRSTLTADGSDTFCYAETDCDYAQYPEYGTWCQAPQPYFGPALQVALMEAQPYWDQAESDALMEEQMLIEEEQMELQAQALASQQSAANGAFQAQLASRGSMKDLSPYGGLNFSSPTAFIGSVIGAFIAAFVITTVQAMMGKDFSSKADRISKAAGGGQGYVYMPEVIIT